MTPSEAKVAIAKQLNADKTLEIGDIDIYKTLRISPSTFYRYVRL